MIGIGVNLRQWVVYDKLNVRTQAKVIFPLTARSVHSSNHHMQETPAHPDAA